MQPPTAGGEFPPTTWSRVLGRDLGHIAVTYRGPVYRFLRARGEPHDRAEDLTQEFFAGLVAGDWLRHADPARGRFRNLLLAVLKRRVLSDLGPGRLPRQQQFEHRLAELPRAGSCDCDCGPSAGETPEEVFEREWARAVVAAARERLRRECEAEAQLLWWEVFAACHPDDPTARPVPQSALATRLGLSRDQVRYALDQAHRRFSRLLREEVRDQVGCDSEVDSEIRELMSRLAR